LAALIPLAFVMSNGGLLQAGTLADAVCRRHDVTNLPAVPAKLVVFDSTPGAVSYSTYLKAFTIRFERRTTFVKYAAKISFSLLYAARKLWSIATRSNDPISMFRKKLCTQTTVPRTASRLFIYSREDALIDSTAVESYINQVKDETTGRVSAELFTSAQ